jgi:hypothetical protein
MSRPPPFPPGPGLRWVRVTPDNVDEIVSTMVAEGLADLRAQLIDKGMPDDTIARALAYAEPLMRQHSYAEFAKGERRLRH